jgi:WD repeat-containing protein 48
MPSAQVSISSAAKNVAHAVHSRLSNWVASGGFDRKIKIWDLAESREAPIRAVNISLCGASSYMAAVDIPLASEQDSIYSLATNASGTVLASGSPSRMVRLWDPRMQNCEIAGLRGHADNIRSLLLSEDAKFVLSASTDATIKLWSTAMQRCLHTFTYHNDSVWSLYSNHPDLEIFYSGDRSGLVCKVDLEGCGDMAEGECVVLCKDDEPPPSADAFSLSEGINSIVAVDDAFLWTATGSSSIMRWQDVKPRRRRAHPARVAARNPISSILGTSFSQPPPLPEEAPAPLIVTTSPSLADRRGVSFAPSLNDSDTDSLSAAGPVPIVTPLYTRRPSSIKQSSMHQISPMAQSSAKTDQCLDGLPLESLVCFALRMAYNSPFSTQSIMQRQQYAESLASLTSAGHRRPSHTPHSQQHSFSLRRTSSRNWDGREETPVVPSSMLAYAQRESASEAVPLRLAANEVILGRRGLIRCEQLNE